MKNSIDQKAPAIPVLPIDLCLQPILNLNFAKYATSSTYTVLYTHRVAIYLNFKKAGDQAAYLNINIQT